MTYRNDVDALAARHAALEAEVQAKTKELAAAAHILDEARDRARLPVLDNIRVASPCPVEWKDMTGDDRIRACSACDKNVYNLSSMTRDEAEALIVERNGNLCVRYFQRKDGTIMLADCVIGAGRKTRRRVIAAGAATLLASAGIGLAARTHERHHCSAPLAIDSMDDHRYVTGQMAVPAPPPPAEEVHDVRGLMIDSKAGIGEPAPDPHKHGPVPNKVNKPKRHMP